MRRISVAQTCCTNCCTKGAQEPPKRPETESRHLHSTTTYAGLGLFVIGRSAVQVRSSAPVSCFSNVSLDLLRDIPLRLSRLCGRRRELNHSARLLRGKPLHRLREFRWYVEFNYFCHGLFLQFDGSSSRSALQSIRSLLMAEPLPPALAADGIAQPDFLQQRITQCT
jgi:hypothetical protein